MEQLENWQIKMKYETMNLILKLICKYMIVINNNDYSNPHEVLICVAIKKQ